MLTLAVAELNSGSSERCSSDRGTINARVLIVLVGVLGRAKGKSFA